jgi:predicted PilT family ATPase
MKTLRPNKLGILLYGAPGGKSSCVAAIATYLHRPVYYVGLKTIQTDRELCDAFKIATTAHANGGVVVLEDIDVMSVYARKTHKDTDNFLVTVGFTNG